MNHFFSTTRWAVWTFVAFASLALGAPAFAQTPAHYGKLDEVVRAAVRDGRSVRAIVRFSDEAARTRARGLITLRGGQVKRALNDVGGLNVVIDAATAEILALEAGTVTISTDAEVRSSAVAATRKSVRSSGARTARERYNRNGRGVSIAVIDSGVRPHADLPAWRIRAFVDFVNGRTTPYDDFGHGTHIAGIAAGSGAASQHLDDPYTGAAPEVDIVALKVLDANGAGSTSNVIAALEWVAANHRTYNIRVVNMSLGHPIYEPAASDPLVQAAEALVRRGIVVVASAGNLGINPANGLPGSGGITSPANGPSIIAVGAVDNKGTQVRSDDTVPNYSSKGPTRFDLIVKPDIVASGHRVVSLSAPGSTLFQNYPALRVPAAGEPEAYYMMLSGTSMAAPVVAGTAALMLDANPRLSAGTVRAVLEFTAQHLPDTNLLTQGAGYLNALGAVRLAGLIKPAVDVGKIWLRSPNGLPREFDMLFGEQVLWAQNVLWGDGVLLGDSAYLHMAAWDDNIVWGQDLENIVWGQCEGDACDNPSSNNIVWGQCDGEGCSNIVWGQCDGDDCNNIVWGQDKLENIVWGQCDTIDCQNIVWGQDGETPSSSNIVWGQCAGDECNNIVWGQCEGNNCNIVWGQCAVDECNNIVWGQDDRALGYWAGNTIWGFWSETVDWTAVTQNELNIVWGQDYQNIVWGQCVGDECNIVWGQRLTILTDGANQ